MHSWLHRELNERENVLQPKAEYFHSSFAWFKKMGNAILIESELRPGPVLWQASLGLWFSSFKCTVKWLSVYAIVLLSLCGLCLFLSPSKGCWGSIQILKVEEAKGLCEGEVRRAAVMVTLKEVDGGAHKCQSTQICVCLCVDGFRVSMSNRPDQSLLTCSELQ